MAKIYCISALTMNYCLLRENEILHTVFFLIKSANTLE